MVPLGSERKRTNPVAGAPAFGGRNRERRYVGAAAVRRFAKIQANDSVAGRRKRERNPAHGDADGNLEGLRPT